MKLTIEKTQTIKTEIELPQYFTTLTGWYYMVLPGNKLLHVTDNGIGVYDGTSCLKYVIDHIRSCNQDAFIAAYVQAMNIITAASGVVHLPLEVEGGAYAD